MNKITDLLSSVAIQRTLTMWDSEIDIYIDDDDDDSLYDLFYFTNCEPHSHRILTV